MINKYLNSKWTSVKKVQGYRHYQVRNVLKRRKQLELFAVCNKKNLFNIVMNDIKNKDIWLSGWIELD